VYDVLTWFVHPDALRYSAVPVRRRAVPHRLQLSNIYTSMACSKLIDE